MDKINDVMYIMPSRNQTESPLSYDSKNKKSHCLKLYILLESYKNERVTCTTKINSETYYQCTNAFINLFDTYYKHCEYKNKPK